MYATLRGRPRGKSAVSSVADAERLSLSLSLSLSLALLGEEVASMQLRSLVADVASISARYVDRAELVLRFAFYPLRRESRSYPDAAK